MVGRGTTIDKVYKTVSKLYATAGWPSLFVTSGGWQAPMIDTENKVTGIVNLKDLEDTEYWEVIEIPKEKHFFIEKLFDKEFRIE